MEMSIFYLFLLFIIGSFVSVNSLNHNHGSKIRRNVKFIPKRNADISASDQKGEVVYEEESDIQNEGDYSDIWIPPPPPLPLFSGGQESFFGSSIKRFGNKMFGDDFALFLVLLTIAGFFGLLISLIIPFTFLLTNGGVIPFGGLNGINGINGINGLGGLGGFGGINGINGINGGFVGRKKRSKIDFKKKLIDILTFLDKALEKHSV